MLRATVALALAVSACIPPPKCGSAANVEAWRTEGRPPPIDDNDMNWWKKGCGARDVRVPTTLHVAGAAGADVFFMPAGSYALWLMTHATANAAKGFPIAVDPIVLANYSKQATTNEAGDADLGANFPGLYVAFTVYDVIAGDPPARDVYVYERVFELKPGPRATVELSPTQHLVNPPSTPAPPTFKGTLVDVRRVRDLRDATPAR